MKKVLDHVMQSMGLQKKEEQVDKSYSKLMWEATMEYNTARQGIDSSENAELIEYYIYMLKAAQAKLSYAIKMCKDHQGSMADVPRHTAV